MPDPACAIPSARGWAWIVGLIMIVIATIIWLGASLEAAGKPSPVQPVARSTDWAIQPTGPAVRVNLPAIRMANTPGKAP